VTHLLSGGAPQHSAEMEQPTKMLHSLLRLRTEGHLPPLETNGRGVRDGRSTFKPQKPQKTIPLSSVFVGAFDWRRTDATGRTRRHPRDVLLAKLRTLKRAFESPFWLAGDYIRKQTYFDHGAKG